LLLLAPKQPNWDLKRDIAPKLEKLDRMTQHSIIHLIQDKINEKNKGKSDLNTLVNKRILEEGSDEDSDEDN